MLNSEQDLPILGGDYFYLKLLLFPPPGDHPQVENIQHFQHAQQ